MRVIAGKFRGIILDAPAGEGTRPVTDRVKETIFNVLGSRLGTLAKLPAVDALDVFAGSGSFGIEALSRGARACVFVERSRAALAALRTNIAKLHAESAAARILTANAWELGAASLGQDFGLIFVDPPYAEVAGDGRIVRLLQSLSSALADDGLLMFRRSAENSVDLSNLGQLSVVDDRIVGSMRIQFFSRIQ